MDRIQSFRDHLHVPLALRALPILAVVVSACFSLDIQDGQVPCGPRGECPSDFTCVAGRCSKGGGGADAGPRPDGAADAAAADAPLGADGAAADATLPDAAADAPTTGTVRLALSGAGKGTIDVGGTACSASCTISFALGTRVTLAAAPDSQSIFAGWSGACMGKTTCIVTIDAAGADVGAAFTVATAFQTLNVVSTGPGSVSVSPAGTSCGLGCYTLGMGSTVTLTPHPEAGFSLTGWTGGGCESSGATPCTLTLVADTRVVARFCAFNQVVDPSGKDTNAGTCAAPFFTITHALAVARPGDTVHVQPGSYSDAETFPLIIPEGVTLVGDESQKGAGQPPTVVSGGGPVPGSTFLRATIVVGKGAIAAGLVVADDSQVPNSECVVLTQPGGAEGATVRNDTIGLCGTDGVYVDQAPGAAVVGNIITGLTRGTGLWITTGGAGTLVQSNVISRNLFGVEADTDADLGGGAAGSAGGNILSCNIETDVIAAAAAGTITVSAEDDVWDHVPPTSGCASAIDLCSQNAVVSTTGAMLAQEPCQ
jgi:uncharacterized protein DUF1565/List-Bact-rpt repeat protein